MMHAGLVEELFAENQRLRREIEQLGPQPDPERPVVSGVGPEAAEVIRQINRDSVRHSDIMVNVEYADLLERKVKELQERLAKLYRGLGPLAHAPAGQPVLVDGDLLRELVALAKPPSE